MSAEDDIYLLKANLEWIIKLHQLSPAERRRVMRNEMAYFYAYAYHDLTWDQICEDAGVENRIWVV